MEELRAWRGRIAAELDAAVAFWERHSHDPEHGGFFSCLSRDGSVYDDTKFVWLQGRQIWVYSRLYRTVPRFRRPELLQAARKAGEFLERHVRPEPGSSRAAFALRRDGRPERLQRSFYSEAFCALGLDELGRAAGEERYRLEWSLKLWWPHAEAMVALLAAQRFQPRPSLVSQFLQLAQYTFDKFRDPEHGEWFGYLNRDGSVALSIKGGPYKGCFHVARALLMCEEMLGDILEGEKPPQ
nr:N-acylglucosamine 2-epimerase isoform X6 [Taeniopygia guttata]